MKTDGIPVEDFYNELDFRESQEIDEHISRSPEIDERPSIDPTLYDDYDQVMGLKLFYETITTKFVVSIKTLVILKKLEQFSVMFRIRIWYHTFQEMTRMMVFIFRTLKVNDFQESR